ncbi:MAG: hypothetical protein KDD41_04585 [Flavobacteriales bacterium]|nr:hypothetical protein [Flavobacteriales bacterium]
MKHLFLFLIVALLVSCSSNPAEQTDELPVELEQKESADTPQPSQVTEIKEEITTLPFFNFKFENDGFEQFYRLLVESCRVKDTAAVLAAIHDTLRFSQYECAYGQYAIEPSCDGCARCTKKGMLHGVFTGSATTEICERLYELLVRYGVGPYSDNAVFSEYQPIEGAYCNFHFVKYADLKNYFEYGAIIPLKQGVEIRSSMSKLAPAAATLPFQVISYHNEPGMEERDEAGEGNWLPYDSGYIIDEDVLTGFEYTLVIFEKTHSGWKITGFYQPPGC